ncbi:toxin-antitoxin system YwqK family antitoxin [Pseudozobellia thermophila]|uniref:Antitoxin component YwqK of the YwqJK toxin-antitoxin module n=1 Tax=Pseudozobellia thermophila TaxID=192903 RepID=A0A1M6LZ53_9FLAO|nr:hypothetical protein [Pseudozobellia thermophila]SHJ76461.1 Antitoxin component YwqK of the YwqJK toxin-antitoxin module [Pseudozobellia thermophila]
MKATLLLYPLLFVLLLSHCKEKTAVASLQEEISPEIDLQEVLKKELVLNPIEGKWYYNNQPFNGHSVKFHPNGALGERLGYVDGKREGVAKRYSDNGVLRVMSHYRHNRLEGEFKTWWENGVLAEESYYKDGVLHGEQRQWYASGELAKVRHLVNGKEEGMQRAWLKNGKLYVNYEAKNGRIFGMRRANSCYQLENEVVVKDK